MQLSSFTFLILAVYGTSCVVALNDIVGNVEGELEGVTNKVFHGLHREAFSFDGYIFIIY